MAKQFRSLKRIKLIADDGILTPIDNCGEVIDNVMKRGEFVP